MFSNLIQIIKTPIIALLSNKMRSFLTMLGVIIGVGAVIVIMSVGEGAQSLILNEIESIGSNLIGVLPGKSEGAPASVMGIVITTLTYEDALAIADERNVPNVVGVAAYSKGISTVSWGSNKYDTNISGVSAGILDVEGGEVVAGRFFTDEEENNLAKVVVLGSTVARELFGKSDPVGQRMKIKNHSFEVIGVMEERRSIAFQDYDDQVFIQVKSMMK